MEDAVLPESHILEVLSRLPLKTIIRCKCVCKRWRDLVSDPYFVDLHLSRSRPCLSFHQYDSPSSILELVEVEHEVDYDRLTLHHVKTLNLHLSAVPYPCNWTTQVGSVNGLICLHNRDFDTTYIFNPLDEEYMILPQPPKPNLEDVRFPLTYGFGVSMTGKYKVIWIYALKIEVYTLGTNQWRCLGPTPYRISYRWAVDPPGVFVNSHVYWIIHGQIYKFDMDTETFESFPSPPGELAGDDQESMQMLGVLKGSLSLFSWTSLGFNVWVMKESWYKAIAVIQENIDPFLKSLEWEPRFLMDGSDGTSILIFLAWHEENPSLVGYCLNTNKILDLNLPGNYFVRMHTYRPSLVKLQNFGSERVRVRSLYSNDTVSAKNRYKSSLKFEQRASF
ncbi:F-box protein At3g07870 [Helianthus annuus]|uniref:Putative F-box domain-containing protein n=1 Tax=Helianthus annuus TaxID=4232 RepID=A0A251T8T5_HELAN|nr:F-box protein At3g07870 [Helianthus annuus]